MEGENTFTKLFPPSEFLESLVVEEENGSKIHS